MRTNQESEEVEGRDKDEDDEEEDEVERDKKITHRRQILKIKSEQVG